MSKPSKSQPNEQFSDEEAMRRTDEVLKRMLNTPPKKHEDMKLGKAKAKPRAAARPK
jgi:hypothetical protein